MKFLAVTIAGMLSVVAATTYEYDEVRAERAHEFYKSLVLTEVDNFDESQQTQLYSMKVGDTVCQAFKDYALFDFNKLSKLGWTDKKPQVAQKVDASTHLIYKVCGGAFAPDGTKIAAAGLITDTASCKKMFEDDSTKGNMYLVKGGKCVQSFNGAQFDATVTEKKDEPGELNQEWSLNYTSTQQCAGDTSKNFNVHVQGVCVKKTQQTVLKVVKTGKCFVNLQYSSEGACAIKYLPMGKYMEQLSKYTGVIFILVGGVMCFFGSRFLPLMIAFLGGLFVTAAIFLIGYNFLNAEKVQMWHLIVLFVVALLIGIGGGYAAWKLATEWATTILAFWLGIMLALAILKLAKVENQNVTLGACAVAGILGFVIGRKYNTGIKKFGTAIIGAFILIRGLSVYIGGFPSEVNMEGGYDAAKLKQENGNALFFTIGYLAGFIILSCAGAIFQIRKLPEKEQEGEAFDDQEESRVCGCF